MLRGEQQRVRTAARPADVASGWSMPTFVDWACYLGCGQFSAGDPARGCVDPTLYVLAKALSESVWREPTWIVPGRPLPSRGVDATYRRLVAATARTRGLVPTRRVGLHFLLDGIETYGDDRALDREAAIGQARARLDGVAPPRPPNWSSAMVSAPEEAQEVSRAVRTIGGYWVMRPEDDAAVDRQVIDGPARAQLQYVTGAHMSAATNARHPLLVAYERLLATIDAESRRRTHIEVPEIPWADENALVLWHITVGGWGRRGSA